MTRLFVTTNGPGEVMGWLRPFLRALYAEQPDLDVTAVVLPCAYATGHESQLVKQLFPRAAVIDPAAYGRFLIGRNVRGMQPGPGFIQYLGGDLFHAVTIARRLKLTALTYKFSKRSYRHIFQRFYALDEDNAHELRDSGAPPDCVRVVGDLVADAVLGSLSDGGRAREPGGVCILAGSRPYEVRFLTPFFVAIATHLHALRPSVPITFVVSPFTSDDELRSGVEQSGDPKLYGVAGRYDAAAHAIDVDGARFAVDRSSDYATMAGADLVISIPGTKCVEAAVLGRPLLVVIPMNRLDEIALNGPGAYLHRVPFIGRPLKTWLARRVASRYQFLAQPNIDAGQMIAPEIRGILRPEEVAQQAAALLDKPHELRAMGRRLAALYEKDAGAAARMAADLLQLARREPAALSPV